MGGAWIDLEEHGDKDDFYRVCTALHSDEKDPEFMFQDSEDIPEGLVDEHGIDASLWAWLKDRDKHDEDAVEAYIKLRGTWDESDFLDSYVGEFDSWTDLAYHMVEEQGLLDGIPEHIQYYFDYGLYGNDLRVEMSEENGYYFRDT
jgi:antirestriction protein